MRTYDHWSICMYGREQARERDFVIIDRLCVGCHHCCRRGRSCCRHRNRKNVVHYKYQSSIAAQIHWHTHELANPSIVAYRQTEKKAKRQKRMNTTVKRGRSKRKKKATSTECKTNIKKYKWNARRNEKKRNENINAYSDAWTGLKEMFVYIV